MSQSVLVLEESGPIQGIIASALEDSALAVYHESQREQFFETAKQLQPDLIFISNSDHKQEYEVCRQLKGDKNLGIVPLILMAESRDDLDRVMLRELKIDGHLRKPFEASALQERIRQFLPSAFPLPAGEAYDRAQSSEELDSDAMNDFSVLDDEMLDLLNGQSEEPNVEESAVPEVDFSDEFSEDDDFEIEEEDETMKKADNEINDTLMDETLSLSEVDENLETVDSSEFEEMELENVEEENIFEEEIIFEEDSSDDEEEGLALDDDEAEALESIDETDGGLDEEVAEFSLEEEPGMDLDDFEEEDLEVPLSDLKESGMEDEMVQALAAQDSEMLDLEDDSADDFLMEEESLEMEIEEQDELSLDLDEDDDSETLSLDGVDPEKIKLGSGNDEFDSDAVEMILMDDDEEEELSLDSDDEEEEGLALDSDDEDFLLEEEEQGIEIDEEELLLDRDESGEGILDDEKLELTELDFDEENTSEMDSLIVAGDDEMMASGENADDSLVLEDTDFSQENVIEEEEMDLDLEEEEFAESRKDATPEFDDEGPTQELRPGLVDIRLDLNDFEEEIGIEDYDETQDQTLNEKLVDIRLDENDFDPDLPDIIADGDEGQEMELDDFLPTDDLAEMDAFVLGISSEEKSAELEHEEDKIILEDAPSKEAIQGDENLEEDLDTEAEFLDEMPEESFEEDLDDEISGDLETDISEEESSENAFEDEMTLDFESEIPDSLELESEEDETSSIDAITKDEIFEEDLDLEDSSEIDELDTTEMEEKALSELNDLEQEMAELEEKDYDLHLEKLDDSPALTMDLDTEEEVSKELSAETDSLEEPELILEDSTEGEDMIESTFEEPVSESPEIAFETELELSDDEYSASDADQVIFQNSASSDEISSSETSEQLGKLLESIITGSVQKSIETAMPELVDQIVKKIKEEM
ncbi:MAG: hypothetical protein HQM13_15670 [SAR324 cluster bacterium]|nr:hypothetical protein [SAR324 cluster bacterium]